MFYENYIRASMLIVSILFMSFCIRPTEASASGHLSIGERDHHQGRYAQVVVGSDRYYYDQGIFYTGTRDHYVAVEAPVGAVVYSVPAGYEHVVIDGNAYYRYRDVYYKQGPRGYEVARVERSHEQKRDNGQAHGNGQGRDNGHGQDENHRHDRK